MTVDASCACFADAVPSPADVMSSVAPAWVADSVMSLPDTVLTQYTVPSTIPPGKVDAGDTKNATRSSSAIPVSPGTVTTSAAVAVNGPRADPIGPLCRILVAPETATPVEKNVATAVPAVQAPNGMAATGLTLLAATVWPPTVRATPARAYPV